MRGTTPAILVLILIGMLIVSGPALAQKQSLKTRVMVDSTSIFVKLFYRIQGCSILREMNDATAFSCPEGVVQRYHLREERIFHIADIESNQQISADWVWKTYGLDGEGVVVAVLDTGVDDSHVEISSGIAGGMSFCCNSYFWNLDPNGHGTHVAGVITADGINERARGVAPGSSLWIGKVCDQNGDCWESDVAGAIEYVVEERISRIIALSLTGNGTVGPDCDEDYLAGKVNWAVEKGVVVVASAGNNGTGVSSPACASEAIAVGSVDPSDYVPSFSGRGTALDIVAPGVDIYTTVPGGGYQTHSGTSMAAAAVSGTVALLFEKNISTSVPEIKSILFKSADDVGYPPNEQGYGRVNARVAHNYP